MSIVELRRGARRGITSYELRAGTQGRRGAEVGVEEVLDRGDLNGRSATEFLHFTDFLSVVSGSPVL